MPALLNVYVFLDSGFGVAAVRGGMKVEKVKNMMNVFWPGESGWSASVSATITADSRVTGQ